MKRIRKGFFIVVLCMLTLMMTMTTSAASKPKKDETITVSMVAGEKKKLNTEEAGTWTSKDESIAVVSATGKVTAVAPGSTKVIFKNEKGNNTIYKIIVDTYCVDGKVLTVKSGENTRKYTMYKQGNYSRYIAEQGCVTTAVAIVASSYGKNDSPRTIHTKWERPAVRKLKGSTWLYERAAISMATASQILKDMGIKNKFVYSFTTESAVKDITANLEKGIPVIIKCHNKKVNGIAMANAHHAIVLTGLDRNGKVVLINPLHGKENKSKYGQTIHLTVEQLVSWFMKAPGKRAAKTTYVTSLSLAGGYILMQE
ncbi:MAG: C39 family peptidase [Muricoprocola sp.]